MEGFSVCMRDCVSSFPRPQSPDWECSFRVSDSTINAFCQNQDFQDFRIYRIIVFSLVFSAIALLFKESWLQSANEQG
jgi:hypothetical protein